MSSDIRRCYKLTPERCLKRRPWRNMPSDHAFAVPGVGQVDESWQLGVYSVCTVAWVWNFETPLSNMMRMCWALFAFAGHLWGCRNLQHRIGSLTSLHGLSYISLRFRQVASVFTGVVCGQCWPQRAPPESGQPANCQEAGRSQHDSGACLWLCCPWVFLLVCPWHIGHRFNLHSPPSPSCAECDEAGRRSG